MVITNIYIGYLIKIFLLILFLVSLYSLHLTNNINNKIEQSIKININNLLLSKHKKIKKIIKNIKNIVKNDKSLVDILKRNKSIRDSLNKDLELIRNQNILYIYILYLDKNNKIRYLADGSKNKSDFYQLFTPYNKLEWIKTYKENKIKFINKNKNKHLWKTLLVPININGKKQGELVIDYSNNMSKKILNIIKPIKIFYYIIFYSIIIGYIFILFIYFYISKLSKENYKDDLTGIYNKKFLKLLENKISKKNYDIVMVDLDHFKQINDLYGHLIGDKALIHAVNIIKSNIKKQDYLIRFGGEEFVVFINKNISNSYKIAEKIRKSLETSFFSTKDYGDITIKASFGLNTNIEKEKTLEEAIKRCDSALYEAKKSGRNCVKIVDNNSTGLLKNNSYDFIYIKELIENNRVCCQYQPIFNNSNPKEIVKYESLGRIKDYNGDIIMPNDFLPLIWKTNVYIKFTKQIIEYNVKKFKKHKENFTINLSLQDILNEEIINIIKDSYKENPDIINKMGIEILEYDKFENIQRLSKIITELKEMGIKIILDDFGSGHSNFFIIGKLEFDEIKIDGNVIIKEIDKNKKLKDLVKYFSDFAKINNIKTTAEFVCNQDIFNILQSMSINNLQGFYLGKPEFLD